MDSPERIVKRKETYESASIVVHDFHSELSHKRKKEVRGKGTFPQMA